MLKADSDKQQNEQMSPSTLSLSIIHHFALTFQFLWIVKCQSSPLANCDSFWEGHSPGMRTDIQSASASPRTPIPDNQTPHTRPDWDPGCCVGWEGKQSTCNAHNRWNNNRQWRFCVPYLFVVKVPLLNERRSRSAVSAGHGTSNCKERIAWNCTATCQAKPSSAHGRSR